MGGDGEPKQTPLVVVAGMLATAIAGNHDGGAVAAGAMPPNAILQDLRAKQEALHAMIRAPETSGSTRLTARAKLRRLDKKILEVLGFSDEDDTDNSD
jgi:hypothetical protein